MVETARLKELAAAQRAEVERAESRAQVAALVAEHRAMSTELAAALRAVSARTDAQRRDDAYAETVMPKLYSPGANARRWLYGFALRPGHHLWYCDPGLAVAFAATGGVFGVGWAMDLVCFGLARLGGPPHRATYAWQVVRARHTLVIACAACDTAAALGARAWPGVPPIVFGVLATSAALRVTNEFGTWGAVGVAVLGLALLVPREGDAGSVERLDFSRFPNWYAVAWLMARAKAWAAGLASPWSSAAAEWLDSKWDRPDPDADARFYRRWSPLYYAFAAVCAAAHVAAAVWASNSVPGFKYGAFIEARGDRAWAGLRSLAGDGWGGAGDGGWLGFNAGAPIFVDRGWGDGVVRFFGAGAGPTAPAADPGPPAADLGPTAPADLDPPTPPGTDENETPT